MIHEAYLNLTPIERQILSGKVQHLIGQNEFVYALAVKLIKHEEDRGTFDNVKFMPDQSNGMPDVFDNSW